MTAILTLNGIPPRLMQPFNAAQQAEISAYAETHDGRVRWRYPNKEVFPTGVSWFVDQLHQVVDEYKAWGANPMTSMDSHVATHSNFLDVHETTFSNAVTLHTDLSYDPDPSVLPDHYSTLRALCVSSMPADFVDLTDRPDMGLILREHVLPHRRDRVFQDALLRDTPNLGGQIITPQPFQTIIFDAAKVPHLPRLATVAHRRILIDAWVEMRWPKNWRERVAAGDVPRLPALTP